MGRIYEALEKADENIIEHDKETDIDSNRSLIESDSTSISKIDFTPISQKTTSRSSKTDIATLSKPISTQLFTPKPTHEYQAIKTKIITRFPNNNIKTIMVTGISRQCGTSTTSVGFAITLASDCNSRVLLVEANTRLPSFNKFFKLNQGLGLTDLFSEDSDKVLPLQTAVTGNLFILPAGDRKAGVNTFFESVRFDNILERLRDDFDFVILDAPPVINFDEPKVIGKKVDGVILVSQAGKSRQRVAFRAKTELEATGANILGVVLNRRKHHIPEWIYRKM